MENIFGLSGLDPNDSKSFLAVKWCGKTIGDQGFLSLNVPLMQRKNIKLSEYKVFADEKHYKTVEAETASKALQVSEMPTPYKIEHNNCRIGTVVKLDSLEYIKNKGTLDEFLAEQEKEDAEADGKQDIFAQAVVEEAKPDESVAAGAEPVAEATTGQPVAESTEPPAEAAPQTSPEQPAAE